MGCLPPFKSLFENRGSFQRYQSPIHNKNRLPGVRLDAIGLGNGQTSTSANAVPKDRSMSINEKENVCDIEYDGGYHVPRGAICVRTDYVSREFRGSEKR